MKKRIAFISRHHSAKKVYRKLCDCHTRSYFAIFCIGLTVITSGCASGSITSFVDINGDDGYNKAIQVLNEACTVSVDPSNINSIQDVTIYKSELGEIILSEAALTSTNAIELYFRAHGNIDEDRATIVTACAYQDNAFLQSQIDIAPEENAYAKYSLQTSEFEEYGNRFSVTILLNDEMPVEITLRDLYLIEFYK